MADPQPQPRRAPSRADATRRADLALTELGAVFEAFPHLLLLIGPDDTFVDYRAGRDVATYAPPETFLGRRVDQVIPEPVAGTLRAALARARDGIGCVIEEYTLPIEGRERHFEARLVPVGEGRVAALVVDAGARKRAERAMARQRTQLEHLLGSSPSVLYRLTLEGREVRSVQLSENLPLVLGHSIETATPIGWWERHLHPEDSDAARTALARAFDSGHAVHEYRFRHADGTWRWIHDEMRLLRDAAGAPSEIIGSLSDITPTRRAEEDLRSSEERFRAIIEKSSDIFVILDGGGALRFVSPSVEDALGYRPEELLGKRAFDHVHPDDLPLVTPAFETLREHAGASARIEFRALHRDGSWRVVEAMGRSLVHVAAVGGIVVTLRDITEQRRLEEQFIQSQKLESIGRLAGGVAHDFNNLLTAILGYTELLTVELQHQPGAVLQLGEIRRAADRARELTQQLLAVARRQVIEPRPIDLNALILESERLLARVLGEDVELVTQLEREPWPVVADPARVQQVILNLVVNARDAMRDGGRLTLRTDNVEVDDAEAAAHAGLGPGRHVRLTVVDTGHGMTPEVQAHLFEPFFTTKAPGQGTGLGLASVYGIVHQGGGAIAAESAPGAGTTFRIWFPRSDRPLAALPPLPQPAPRGGTGHLLVVEDDSGVRDLTVRLLEGAGFTVHAAARGDEALEIARRESAAFDLLLTDVVMPGMGGLALAEALLAMQPGLRVLFVSGYTQDSLKPAGATDGQVAFLAKPYSPSRLLARLRELLDAPARA